MKACSFCLVITFIGIACSTSKNAGKSDLYKSSWQLEYVTGPRIAFEGLFPEKKPILRFNKKTGRVEGNDSCNGYHAPFTTDGRSLEFGEPGPSTLMYCGEGEQIFRKTLKKINGYHIKEGKLELLQDGLPMMRFRKV